MEGVLRAIEVEGEIDELRQLHLDNQLPVAGPSRVRVIILIPEPSEISESEWLGCASKSPAFAFLNEPEEDIYTLSDGKPFQGGCI
jgi:hypothetical protein